PRARPGGAWQVSRELWDRFRASYYVDKATGLSVDISRMAWGNDFFARMEPEIQRAYAEMAELERGAIANADENRMVGHYWLRAPELAPTPAIQTAIETTIARIEAFAADVHSGRIGAFRRLLVVGIGGSALGPEFVAAALATPRDRLRPLFFDNTD